MDKQVTVHNVSPLQMDILKEIGNIGSGNAVTSFSMLVDKRLDMQIAEVKIEKGPDILSILGSEENYVSSTIVEVFGEIEAMLILSLEKTSTLKLINLVNQLSCINKPERKDVSDLDDVDFSILGEFGNILAGSYLKSLNILTNLSINQSPPQTAIDMAGAILSYPAAQFTTSNNEMIFVKSSFNDDSGLLQGTYVLILSEESLDKVLGSVGTY